MASVSAVPAGQLACQTNSYLRELTATVLSCVEAEAPPPAKKDKKKSKKNPDGGDLQAEPGSRWVVQLSDTVLFPEGGGQPPDHGTVGGVKCVDVQVVEGFACHTLTAPVEVGQTVTVTVDWQRRWDHMQQHTGQHLITATAVGLFGFPTVAWHLGPTSSSTLDLDTAGEPFTDSMLAELEATVNERVRHGHAISPKWIAPKDPEMATIRRNKDLPDDVVGDVRVLTIDGIDKNLCCGTHVMSTSHLSAVKLLRAEKVKKVVRLHFCVGDRLLALAGDMFTRQLALTAALAVAPERHLEQVTELSRKVKETDKKSTALGRELAEATAVRLSADAAQGQRVVSAHREAGDMEWMVATASAAGQLANDALLFLTCGVDGSGMFMLAGPPDTVKALGPKVAEVLEGRGGGKGRFQGKVASVSKHPEALEMLKGAIDST